MLGFLVDLTQLVCLAAYFLGTYQGGLEGDGLAATSMVVAVILVLLLEEKERARKVEIIGYVAMMALQLMAVSSDTTMFSNLSWVIGGLLGIINIPGIQNLRRLAGKE